jgi:succinate dehydrogenase / fumarate reductase cytochrome b subunit
LGLAPVGVWTVNHLWDNLAAFRGGEAWERTVTEHASPAAQVATYAVVLVPLILHTVWGLARLRSSRLPGARYGGFAHLRSVLHRSAAIGVLLFLGAHLWLAVIRPRVLGGGPEPFADIAREMRFHRPTLAVYLLGVLGTVYHLANGFQAFAVGWDVRWVGRETMDRASPITVAVFLVLLAMGWGAIAALWRAGAIVGP